MIATGGCAIQPRIIQQRHWQLNDTIRTTHVEQLLLNIVRLRHDEPPYFLQMSSITTQFSTQGNIGVTGTIPESGVNVLGLSGGVAYSESPVVTWSLPDSRDFYGRLLAPMGADELTALANAGWDPTRILRVGIKKINRLRNRDFRVEEGVYTPSSYKQFVETLDLMSELSREGSIDFSYGVKSSMGGGKFPMDKLDITAIPEGLQHGLQFMTRDDPNMFEPLKLSKPLFLRFSKESDKDPRAMRLRQLLNLAADKYSFGIVDTGNSGIEQLRSESGMLSQTLDTGTPMAEIVLNNRSMMEVLSFASVFVQVPEGQSAMNRSGEDEVRDLGWLNVLVSQDEPTDAWIKINYRERWYYIAADDAASRQAIGLLDALFQSVIGNVPGAKPLLTIPVK